MKILIIGVRWPPETFIARRIHALLDVGFQVSVAASSVDGEWPARDGLRLVRLPNWKSARRRRALELTSMIVRSLLRSPAATIRAWNRSRSLGAGRGEFIKWASRLLPFAGLQADVVHFEWNLAAVDYLPLFDLLEAPVVVSCRGSQVLVAPSNPSRQDAVQKIREVFDKAAAVHCISQATLQAAEDLGLNPAKAVVIPPAVDTRFFSPSEGKAFDVLGSPGHPIRVLSVGRLVWHKGHEFALEAIGMLRKRGLSIACRIIGEGEHLEAVAFWRRHFGLEDCVSLLGAASPEKVRAEMAWADVFLHAAVSEGFCNAVVEAQAMGLPVVTSDAGGLPENVEDGVTGFVVPCRCPEALAEKIALLAGNPKLRARMSAAGRERVAEKFEIAGQAAAFAGLYHSVARARVEASNVQVRGSQTPAMSSTLARRG